MKLSEPEFRRFRMGDLVKRAVDIVGAAMGLILTAPVLLAGAIVVRFGIGRQILFRQVRPGKGARLFTLYKLRTMTDERDASGCLLPDAQRLNRTGQLLRRTSIDELPQLWNVLKGEMSLVGPRPLLRQYLPRYSAFQRRRHLVKPGITGWTQINGRNALTWEEKFEHDIWYVDHWSLKLDFTILLMTVGKVLLGEGINRADCATSPEFSGNPDQRQI